MNGRGQLLAIAHGAGNDLESLRKWGGTDVDMVEADIHLFRGRIEVRHAKTIGPLPIYWERWHVVRTRSWPTLEDLLRTAAPATPLLLDLKGPYPWLSRRVLTVLRRTEPPRTVTVCARQWMHLRAFSRAGGFTRIASVGSRRQLGRVLRRLARRPSTVDGVSIRDDLVDRNVIAALRCFTPFVLVWDVRSGARVRELAEAGVGGFIVADADLLGAVREMRETRS